MKMQVLSRFLWKVGPVLVFIAFWELIARCGIVTTASLFPPFSAVIEEVYILFLYGLMAQGLLSTLVRVVAGLFAGSLSGIAVGIFMGWKEAAGRSLAPIISILYPIPALGWLPLLMIWVGINETLPMAIITISSFFPVCYSTSAGIRNVDRTMIKAAHILGASDRRILLEVVLPNAAPHLFAGLKLSSGMAWRTVIASEMVAIPTGIGALMMKAESLVRVDVIMSCLVVLSVMCLLFERLFAVMEKRWTGRWSNNVGN